MKSNAYPQLYRLCEQRYSCRAYSDRKVERDTVLTVLDIVRLAPSACNRQPWKFLVADSDEQREAILSSYDREWIRTAPELLSHAASTTRLGIAAATARTTPMSMFR